jgi:outer membrane protein, heavy metal efflux system
MYRLRWRVAAGVVAALCAVGDAHAQTPLTWPEVRARLAAANPTLLAGEIGIAQSKAAEITASLRPNPQLSVTNDQIDPLDAAREGPLANLVTVASVSYLRERQGKRELRLESARRATTIADSTQADLARTLLFTLRNDFVQTLQAKAVVALTTDTLASFDRLLAVSRDRLQAGDIAQVDFDRLELQREQLEADVESATVGLRTSKIQLLALLNDPTPADRFDVAGPFDAADIVQPVEELRQAALAARPDLLAAMQAVDKARVDHRLAVANGSADPTISVDAGFPQSPESYTPSLAHYVGVAVSVPVRVFDRNQGEKTRTELEIARLTRLADAVRAEVISDVDSAYATAMSTAGLVHRYKALYLAQAARVRDTVTFSYQNGGASLLDFLQAEQEYRTIQLNYANLIGTHLLAVSQLDRAVGREVIP